MGALKTYYTTARSFLYINLIRRNTSPSSHPAIGAANRFQIFSNTKTNLVIKGNANTSSESTPDPVPDNPYRNNPINSG